MHLIPEHFRPRVGVPAAGLIALSLLWLPGSARATIAVLPHAPTAASIVVLELVAHDSPEVPPTRQCVSWTVTPPNAFVIRAQGTAQPAAACPPPVQELLLGRLPEGHYRIEARITGEDGLFNAVVFDVLSPLGGAPADFDVRLDEPQPLPGRPTAFTLSSDVTSCEDFEWSAPVVAGDTITLDGHRIFYAEPCGFYPHIAGNRFALPPLTAGLKTLVVSTDGAPRLTRRFTVADDPTILPTRGGVYRLHLRWLDANGVERDAFARRLTDESGQFWFFDRDNPEVTVKVLDGRAVNGKIWVFAASMTNVGFVLDVVEQTASCGGTGQPACRTRSYLQRPLTNHNILDTGAF